MSFEFEPLGTVRAAVRQRRTRNRKPVAPVPQAFRPYRPAPVMPITPRAGLRALSFDGGSGSGSGGGRPQQLLWNERSVDSFGLTHRIVVPLSPGPLDASASAGLTSRLAARWSAPGALSNGTQVTFVSVAVATPPGAPTELQVMITTTRNTSEAQVANLRTIRDLRHAVDEIRTAANLAVVENPVAA